MKASRDTSLDTLHPYLARKLGEALEQCHREGLEVYLFEGFRSHARQQALYNQGRNDIPGRRVTNARPGKSWHQFGLAVDLVFKSNGVWKWSGDYDAVGKIMEAHEFEWGRRWRTFPEDAHFQMRFGITLAKAQEIYVSGGIIAVWSYLMTY